jgi:predicted Fe-Mo cluster-binding NifX family protein
MKVVVSSTGKDLDSEIDPRFGRCAYFILADTDTMAYEAFDNANLALGGGAGIQSAQFVASKGAKAVITGNCGPNAVRTLAAAGVEVIVGQSGSVRDAVQNYKTGKLKATTQANVADHYGMGGGGGRGGGMGGGRGCGRASGQGMGRGAGMGGYAAAPPGGTPPSAAPNDDVASLKSQVQALQAQVAALQSRIKDSEKS